MALSGQRKPDIGALKAKGDIRGLIKAGVYNADSNGRWDEEIRSAAAAAVRQKGAVAVIPLAESLGDNDVTVRRFAARLLEDTGDWRAVDQLVGVLSDEDAPTREAAINALARIGAPALDSLAHALESNHETARRLAVETLVRIKDARSIALLAEALRDQDAIVRRLAVEGLGQDRDQRFIEALIAALADQDEVVRCLAAEGLGRSGDPRAIGPLVGTLAAEDNILRQTSAKALEQIGKPAVEALIAALNSDINRIRLGVVAILARIAGAGAVEPLVSALGDENLDVRLSVAKTLGDLQDCRAVERLVSCLEEGAPLRSTAAVALVKIGQQPEAGMAERMLKSSREGHLLLLEAVELWNTVAAGTRMDGQLVLGVCTKCGREVNGLSEAERQQAIRLGNNGLAQSTSRFCMKCNDLYCYSCGRDDAFSERCPKCWINKTRGFVNPIQFLIDNEIN